MQFPLGFYDISLWLAITAIILLLLLMPRFSTLIGKELSFGIAQNYWLIPVLLGFVLLVGLFAGSYPAFFLSSFHPVRVLKGSLKAGAANSVVGRPCGGAYRRNLGV